MKNFIYSLLLVFLIPAWSEAQGSWVSGSIDQGSQANSVALYIRSTNNFDANKCDNLVFTLRIPVSAGNAVVLSQTYLSPAFSHLSFNIQKLNVTDGAYYYYLVSGNGSVIPAPGQIISAGNAFKVMELGFSGGVSSVVEMVNLETDLPGNMYIRPQFYIQINLGDITRYNEIFYGTGAAVAVNNEPGTGNDWVGTPSLVLLPVQFMSFSVSEKNTDALLSWSVAAEPVSTREYIIERSIGSEAFRRIGTAAARRSAQTEMYNFTDEKVALLSCSQTISYRIRQVQTNGREILSEIKTARFTQTPIALSVYPNPASTKTSLSFMAEEAGMVNISIMTADGITVQQERVRAVQGLNLFSLDLRDLPAGSYHIILTEKNTRKIAGLVRLPG